MITHITYVHGQGTCPSVPVWCTHNLYTKLLIGQGSYKCNTSTYTITNRNTRHINSKSNTSTRNYFQFHNPRIVDRGPQSPFDTSPRRAARASAHASLAAACMHLLLPPAASQGPPPPHAAHIHQRGSLWTTIFIVDTIDPLCPGLLSRAQAPTQHDARHDNLCPVLLRVAHWMMPAWMAQRATGAPVQGVAASCESDSHALRRVHEASPN